MIALHWESFAGYYSIGDCVRYCSTRRVVVGYSPLPGVVVFAAGSAALLAQGPLTFKKVDFYQQAGDEEKKRDARLVLDPVSKILTFSDEGRGEAKAVYARIPYANISKIVYERSAHRRYGAGVLVNPLLFFTKGKKHWLTMEFKDLADLPQGFVYGRLDKDNFRQILSALAAGTGIEIEEIIED